MNFFGRPVNNKLRFCKALLKLVIMLSRFKQLCCQKMHILVKKCCLSYFINKKIFLCRFICLDKLAVVVAYGKW